MCGGLFLRVRSYAVVAGVARDCACALLPNLLRDSARGLFRVRNSRKLGITIPAGPIVVEPM